MPRRPRSESDLIRELSAELRRDEQPFTYARLADLLREQGRLVEARATCEQCIARHPDYVTIHLTLTRVCEAEGDLDRAEGELRVVVAAEPHNRMCLVDLGRLLLQRGAVAEARRHLEHALFLAPGDAAARALLARASGKETARADTTGRADPAHSATAVDRALDLLGDTEGVRTSLLVDSSGLLIGSRGRAPIPEDSLSALANETWELARSYMVRMQLGTLRQATIVGDRGTFVLATSAPGLLAVAVVPQARLGFVNLQIETARNLLAAL